MSVSTSGDPSRDERSRRTADLLARARLAPDRERAELLDEVVLINRQVAEAVAMRYRNRGVPLEDLEQIAYEGLVKAVQRFDPARDQDLLTYAVPTMRGEVQRHFRDRTWAVRPPRPVQELRPRILAANDRLRQELGREPRAEEVCRRLGIGGAAYADAETALGCFQPTSLDHHVDEDGGAAIADLIADREDGFAVAEARCMLATVLPGLSPGDRRVLRLRFVEDRTQREIGDELGIGQVQVSRLLARILSDLRLALGHGQLVT